MRLIVTKGSRTLFEIQHLSEELLRRIANEWFIGRQFAKAMRGYRGQKGLSLERLKKAHDPDGLLRHYATELLPEGIMKMSTDDPCGGHLITLEIMS